MYWRKAKPRCLLLCLGFWRKQIGSRMEVRGCGRAGACSTLQQIVPREFLRATTKPGVHALVAEVFARSRVPVWCRGGRTAHRLVTCVLAGCSIPVWLVVCLRMVLSDALVGAAFYVKVRRTWGRLVISPVTRELAGCSIPVWFAVTGRVSAWVALTGASVRDSVREVSGTL